MACLLRLTHAFDSRTLAARSHSPLSPRARTCTDCSYSVQNPSLKSRMDLLCGAPHAAALHASGACACTGGMFSTLDLSCGTAATLAQAVFIAAGFACHIVPYHLRFKHHEATTYLASSRRLHTCEECTYLVSRARVEKGQNHSGAHPVYTARTRRHVTTLVHALRVHVVSWSVAAGWLSPVAMPSDEEETAASHCRLVKTARAASGRLRASHHAESDTLFGQSF